MHHTSTRSTLRAYIGSWCSLAFLIVCIVGCKVGPNYFTPFVHTKPSWTQEAHPRLIGEPANLESWWTYFQDPTLDCLIQNTSQQNFTLRQAAQRIIEARAHRGIAVGNLFPQQQNEFGAFSRSRTSSNTANFFSFPGIFEPNLNPSNWNVGLNVAWELDFWGRYRRAIEAADASLDASVAAYDEVSVLLLSEVAASYVEMRTYERRIALAQKNLGIQERTLKMARDKLQAGIGSALDVAQAETNYGQTAAVLPALETRRRQASHKLCILMGREPIDLIDEVGYTAQIPQPPSGICFGIPADLLRRRPDVRKAERNLAAQSARIGIAQSDFYPHISLNGNIGYTAEEFSRLGRSNSANGIISPNFSWNLLNYGRIKNNVEAEKAAFLRLTYAYQSSVLDAEREAEDAQVAFVYGFDRQNALSFAVNGASVAVDKAIETYEVGTIDFGRVFVLQSELLRQQDQLAQTEGEIASSLIAMFKALGGGWELSRMNIEQPATYAAQAFDTQTYR